MDNAAFPRSLRKTIEFVESFDEQNVLVGVQQGLREGVLRVLNTWGNENKPSMKQIVSKRSLKHEIEECLPALQHLMNWRDKNNGNFVAVDVCGGKGVFSLLLKDLATIEHHAWKSTGAILEKIVLVEWADIDWTHLECDAPGEICVDIWRKCNVNEVDEVVEKLLADVTCPLVLTGIHLCGQLSLSFLSIVNGLGADRCPSFCLAPCCMPKEVLRNKPGEDQIRPAVVCIYKSEIEDSRKARLDIEQRRLNLRKNLTQDSPDGTLYPCWGCGRFGHRKAACVNPFPKKKIEPPMTCLDVSHILREPSPCMAYCSLLLSSVDGNWSIRKLWETGIVSSEASKQLESNWNRDRKSIYLVVQAS